MSFSLKFTFSILKTSTSMGNNVSIPFNNFIKQRKPCIQSIQYITFYEIGYILLEVGIPQRTLTPFISAATVPVSVLFCKQTFNTPRAILFLVAAFIFASLILTWFSARICKERTDVCTENAVIVIYVNKSQLEWGDSTM